MGGSVEECMHQAKHKVAHVVMVDQDQRVQAQRDFHLQPLLYEYSLTIQERYIVVAVIRTDTNIHTFADLQGKRACFPEYRGASYMSVLETLQNKSLISRNSECSPNALDAFFSANSCQWRPNQNNCDLRYKGEAGALRCLADGRGDVAFVSSEQFQSLINGQLNETWTHDMRQIKLLCPFGTVAKHENEPCYLHWTSRGTLMIHNKTELARKNEIYNSLRDMDKLFGKQYQTHTTPFSLFGPFDRKNNVMFRDTTDGLRGITEIVKDKLPRLLERSITQYANSPYCAITANGSTTVLPNLVNLFIVLLIMVTWMPAHNIISF